MKNKKILLLSFLILGIVLFYFLLSSKNLSQRENKYQSITAVIYKSPYCGCCQNYADYLKSQGFNVNVKVVKDEELEKLKNSLGIPENLYSCHTVFIDNYFIEGHVPLETIDKLLTEKPNIKGIALPGMPLGSPGMSGLKLEKWRIYSLDKKGKVNLFIEI